MHDQSGIELKNRYKIRLGRSALISQFGERIDPLLNRPVNLEIDDSTRGLSVEGTAQRLQNPIQSTCSTYALRPMWGMLLLAVASETLSRLSKEDLQELP
jgi:hypothetical protein